MITEDLWTANGPPRAVLQQLERLGRHRRRLAAVEPADRDLETVLARAHALLDDMEEALCEEGARSPALARGWKTLDQLETRLSQLQTTEPPAPAAPTRTQQGVTMPTNPPTSLPVALKTLRRPIEAFTPRHAKDRDFKADMLGLAELLEEMWSGDEDETLESDAVWTALYAFPILTAAGPAPEELVDLAVGGDLMDADAADTLRTLAGIKRTLQAFEPPGFAAALWRAVLLAMFGMIELFVIIDDERNAGRCFELLDTAEAMADRFMGKA